jgi:hypothetical protein
MQSYQSLPDLAGYRSRAAKRIHKLSEEHADKTAELGRLGNAVEEARQALQDARGRDTEARALAARAGDEDPGRVHEEKARERLAELEDQHEVMQRVVADVEADLSKTITESKPELIEEARKKRDEAARRYTRAHRELREAHDEQRHHAGVARWAYQGAAHFSGASPNVHVLSVPDTLPADDLEQASGDENKGVRLSEAG